MKTKLLITSVAAMLISIAAHAQTFTVNTVEGVPVTYAVTNSDAKTVQVGSVWGWSSPAIDNTTEGSITLPATVSYGGVTYQVTSIAGYAFYGCSNLTSVGNLSSCTSIEGWAFSGCSSLTSVDLSTFTSISEGAFSGCSKLTSVGNLSSCTSIGSEAFNGCSSLTSVDLSSCTSIEGWAFSGCSKLTSVGNLSSCTSIGSSAFSGCSSLTSVGNLSSCTTIGSSAFFDCSSLTSVGDLPSCTSIGDDAFYNCSKLTSVGDLPSCTTIGYRTFYNCYSLTSVDLSSCTTIGYRTFYNCSKLTSVDLSSCTSIGGEAFYNCSKLTSVDLSSCTSIGNSSFSGCSSLASVDLSSCTSIGNSAFSGCSSLTSVDLSSCTSIGNSSFSGCSSLASVDLASCTSISEGTFSGCSSLTSVDLSACTTIGSSAFSGCSSLTSVDLSACTTIGSSAFSGCSKLTSVGNLSSCTSIGYQAFYNCSSLTSVDLSSCTSIEGWAFSGCSKLTSVGNLSSCTSIGYQAFYNCSSLFTITLPSTTLVTLSSSSAIPSTMSVLVPGNLINSYKTAENWSEISSRIMPIGAKTEWNVDLSLNPSGTSSALMTAIGSANLANVIDLKIKGDINGYDIFLMRNQMPNLHRLDMSDANIKATSDNFCYYGDYTTSDNVLGAYAFYQQDKLVDVKLPKSIKSIGYDAFCKCSNLSNIVMYEGLQSIEGSAFSDCSKLNTVVLPSTVETIGYSAFYNCNGLKNLTLPAALKTIGGSAFYQCYSLTELVLPAGLKTIENSAFYNCSSLTELVLPAGLQSIGSGAFGNCSNIRVVKVAAIDPGSVNIADNTFPPTVYTNATLYIPYDETTNWAATYNAYFWHTRWGQFTNKTTWNPTYEYVTIGGDYEQSTGTIPGDNIDADMGNQSGYIVGKDAEQTFDEVNIDNNGYEGGSIIADGDVTINDLYCDISITANRWYFFCFPFDIRLRSDISYDGTSVWHEYDGAARANGDTGWKKLGRNAVLKAGEGYIFQGNKTGTLTIEVVNPDLKSVDKDDPLNTHRANNEQDASWNFVGNPYLSYFDMDDLDFDAPITVWNGSNYDAIRPGDDDYHFQPYQAFFVQKPKDIASLTFVKKGQETYHQSQAALAAAKARRANAAKDTNRRIVNLTVSDGENTDKTRVVLNESKSRAYEMDCDASKFFSQERVPQIYTIDGDVNYAINERPVENGTITLGFKANKEGEFTLSAPRMDARCLLKDNVTGSLIDLQDGDYTFSSKDGTYNDRFTLIVAEKATGIKDAETDLAGNKNTMYDLSGRKITSYRGGDGEGLQKGVVIKDGQKVIVK